jgi:hypothetical protein
VIISLDDAKAKYGEIVRDAGGVPSWAGETTWMVIHCPQPEVVAVLNNSSMGPGHPARHIYCNTDMQDALTQAFQNVIDRQLLGELKTFDGCWMMRDVRAVPGQLSCHAYGLAIDLNASTNGLGEAPTFSPEFVACFTDAGFSWGGNFSRVDGMHFSYAWE